MIIEGRPCVCLGFDDTVSSSGEWEVPVLQPAAVQGLQVPEPGLSEPELRLSWLLPNKLLRLIPLNTVFRLRSLQRCHRLWN